MSALRPRPFLQASSFPCVVVYVMDTSRSVNPVTFMSNMLYACRCVPSADGRARRGLTPPLCPLSILYKTKLPFIVVMNKVSSPWPRPRPLPPELSCCRRRCRRTSWTTPSPWSGCGTLRSSRTP